MGLPGRRTFMGNRTWLFLALLLLPTNVPAQTKPLAYPPPDEVRSAFLELLERPELSDSSRDAYLTSLRFSHLGSERPRPIEVRPPARTAVGRIVRRAAALPRRLIQVTVALTD